MWCPRIFSHCKLRIIDLNLESHQKQRVDYTYDELTTHMIKTQLSKHQVWNNSSLPSKSTSWWLTTGHSESSPPWLILVVVHAHHYKQMARFWQQGSKNNVGSFICCICSLHEARYSVHSNHHPYRVPFHHPPSQPSQKIHQHQLHRQQQLPTLGKQGKGRPGLMARNCR